MRHGPGLEIGHKTIARRITLFVINWLLKAGGSTHAPDGVAAPSGASAISHDSQPGSRRAERPRTVAVARKRAHTMQLNQIRYFLALCAERNFTRAAVRRGVAQPTVTNGIRALEQSLGGRLFYRRRQVVLTALGEAVYPYLSRIIDSVDLACAAAASLSAEQLANNQAVASPSEKPLAPVGRAEVNGLRRAL
jgi:hypothetical protein